MIQKILFVFTAVVSLGLVWSCKEEAVPLDEEQFKSLLIDMHRVDGTLAVARRTGGSNDLKNYAYYNDLFKKYGVTRADFDSCLHYYSAQNARFSALYDAIVDSLNKEVTVLDKIIDELKANDSVNYFPTLLDTAALDTLRLDSVVTVVVDSIVPGLYKFSTTLQFDSVTRSRSRRIVSFFVSPDGKDTLHVRNIMVYPDTLKRDYSWSQYADSVYSRLVIRYMEPIPVDERPKVFRNGKEVKGEKEKLYDLEDFGGRAWDNQLFRPYISRSTEERLKSSLRR